MEVVDPSSGLAGMQLLENRPESTLRTVQPPAGSHRETTEDRPDLRRREPLPLGQEQDLAISWAEPVKCLAHQRLLRVGRLLRGAVIASRASRSWSALRRRLDRR
jgi:hypothetical protein